MKCRRSNTNTSANSQETGILQVLWSKIDAVFFDYDGVLVDSVDIKGGAYAQLFAPLGDEIRKFAIEFHRWNGGMDRYRKIEAILSHFSLPADKILQMAESFSDLTKQAVIAAPALAVGWCWLSQARMHEVPAFLVSGTPEVELLEIVRARNELVYFDAVRGSPQLKKDILREILQTRQLEAHRCLMIGDAPSDFEAALANGLHFVAAPMPTAKIQSKIGTDL